MTDYAHGSYAAANRKAKALTLAKFLWANPGPHASSKDRRAVERLAGVRRCSDETWDLADDLIALKRRWIMRQENTG